MSNKLHNDALMLADYHRRRKEQGISLLRYEEVIIYLADLAQSAPVCCNGKIINVDRDEAVEWVKSQVEKYNDKIFAEFPKPLRIYKTILSALQGQK